MNGISSRLELIRSRFERHHGAVAILLLAAFFVDALIAALLNSGAGDELAAHIPCGYLYWKSGVFSGGIDNFPLGQLLVTLPAGLFRVPYTLYTEEHLFLFRVIPLLMGLGLCALVWKFATKLHGPGTGLMALFFAALCPNLIAHSTIATLDLPVAFFIFLTIVLLDRYIERPTGRRMVDLSLGLSAAAVIKIQALLLVPYVVLVLLISLRQVLPVMREDPAAQRRARRSLLLSWLILPLTGFVLVNLVYLHLPGRGGALLPPFFVAALRGALAHGESGHVAYLLGNYSRQGWWYFFPVAVAVKTPLPELLLAKFGLLRRQGRREVLFLTIPLILFLGAAMTSRVNIGLRHVLMIYPFLAVAAGIGTVRLWGLADSRVSSLRRSAAVLALLACLAGAVGIAPHHLSYFNILAGGPMNGHKVLVDSNYDWGLNDRFLRRHIEAKGLSYAIDPPAFRPANGRLLINANALYGVMNLGSDAYKWLKRFEPVDRIAYTWFEYDVPPGTFREEREDVEARSYVLAQLFARDGQAASIRDPAYRTILARGFAEVGAYDAALEEFRAVLSAYPDYAPALALGGEIMIRWKLGVLFFRGNEYLAGFRTPRPSTAIAPDPETLVGLARRGGMAGSLSRVEGDLGNVFLRGGDRDRAAQSLNLALRLDPSNQEARGRLQSLGGSR